MSNIVKRLQTETKEEAAIDIVTCDLNRTINKDLAEQAAPLLKELLRTGMSENQGILLLFSRGIKL